MTRRSFLAALFLLGMALPASAQQSVPLKGGFDGEVIAASGPPNANVLTAVGEGQLTHLGQTSIEQTYVFDNFTGTFVGTATLTAANGDELDCIFEGVETPDGTISGTFTLVGGTGRFRNATGGGAFTGIDYLNGTFSIRLDGTVSAPGR
jgi:hypothetical protein